MLSGCQSSEIPVFRQPDAGCVLAVPKIGERQQFRNFFLNAVSLVPKTRVDVLLDQLYSQRI